MRTVFKSGGNRVNKTCELLTRVFSAVATDAMKISFPKIVYEKDSKEMMKKAN